ncbi:MAG TPA: phosphatase PAP2-related protein [Chitinophagales bacterium]|nr:phosphatase PAP2-related protein [Chitinophagales bacterium]
MMQWVQLFKKNWWNALEDRYFAVRFVINLVVCYALYMYFTNLLVLNRFREGVILSDPIQQLFTPVDLSLHIFILTYTCILAYIVYIIPRPREFYYAARAFLVVFILRFSFIYLVPLSPPKTMIVLNDPVLNWIVGNNNEIMNDLFFSGHVADVCIFIYCVRYNPLRYFMIVCVIITAIMLVWQQVHYTADVVAAPFFAYVSYRVFAQKGIELAVAKQTAEATATQVITQPAPETQRESVY